MTLVYCSRDFSTLRSLYPRPYWSLTTGGGAARNSYKCKYICCCVILVLLCLLLSPVLAFLYREGSRNLTCHSGGVGSFFPPNSRLEQPLRFLNIPVLMLRKKIKRGGSTVIWKWKWGYKSAPENDFPIEIGNSESAKSCMRAAYAQIRSRNRFPVSGSRFPVRICAPIFISRHLRLIFFLSST